MEQDNYEEVLNGTTEELKVHYHFRDDSHDIDALVRNRCEAEILGLMREVSRILDVPFRVDAIPPAVGGFEEFLTLIGQHREQIALIRDTVIAVLTMTGSAVGAALFLGDRRKHAKQQTALNDIAIEKAKLELKKMQREEGSAKTGHTDNLQIESPVGAEEIAQALLRTKKVQLKRSNLYRNLTAYAKVDAVGYSVSHRGRTAEKVITRDSFAQYILEPEQLEPLLYKRVEIEIVSPVLRAGNHNWRGVFERKSINFELDDGEFRRQVLNQEVSFQNGSKLICDLEVQLREDEVGDQEVTKRVVRKVHAVLQVQKANPDAQGQLDLGDPNLPKPPGWGSY